MFKKATVFVILVLFLFSCASTGKNNDNDSDMLEDLDIAIIKSAQDIIARVPANTKIALFNISSNDIMLTNYVIEEISVFLVSRANFIVLERNNLEIIEAEQRFQLSGSVRDEDILSIANKYGATSVVSCSITGEGNFRRLRVRTLEVETGIVQSLTSHRFSENVIQNNPMDNAFSMIQDILMRRTYTILIPDFTDSTDPQKDILLGYFITNELRKYLSQNTSHGVLVDRFQLEEIYRELDWGRNNDDTISRISNIVTPDIMIRGRMRKVGSIVYVNMDVMDLMTQQIMTTISFELTEERYLNMYVNM